MSESEDDQKIKIGVEAVKTPKGTVPTVKGLHSVVGAILAKHKADFEGAKSEMSTLIEDAFKRQGLQERLNRLEAEIGSIRKLIAEQLISLQVMREDLNDLLKKVDSLGGREVADEQDIKKLIAQAVKKIEEKVGENNRRLELKILELIEKLKSK
ncbi:MAG: hypothetical protein ACFE68_02620 [Candidatus Hodarchaeota archaeon]